MDFNKYIRFLYTIEIQAYKQMNNDLDTLKIAENKKLMKELDSNQKVVLSTKLVKINHINKRQTRILVLTQKNIYNILPDKTFMSILSRVKRKIPFSNIVSMTVSRFGNEFVVHVIKEHDYRFSAPSMKLKIVEAMVDIFCNYHKKKMPIYYYDDLTLQNFTTTIIDVDKKKKKIHTAQPLYMDAESLKKSDDIKGESKLIFKNQNTSESVSSFSEFQLLKVLGRGAFGKVMLCQNIQNKKYYAIKSMRKQSLIEKQHVQKTKTEKYLLEQVNHPFLVSLQYAFQTKQKIFFIMRFISGGQMFTHLRKDDRFSENRAKFYAAQIFMGVKYLHDMGYVYRDLKPENILFDVDGYLKLSDYGLAKALKPGQKTYSLVGTPDYVSPQVILSKGQRFSTDWWSFGIIIYEMLYSSPPFYNQDQQIMFQDILNKQVVFYDSGRIISDQAKDMIINLLKKDPKKRLGSKDQNDIRNHPWFADINFQKMLKKQYIPQFIPDVKSDFDVTNFDQQFTNEEPINSLVTADMMLLSKFQKQFNNMGFSNEEKIPQKNYPSFKKNI